MLEVHQWNSLWREFDFTAALLLPSHQRHFCFLFSVLRICIVCVDQRSNAFQLAVASF